MLCLCKFSHPQNQEKPAQNLRPYSPKSKQGCGNKKRNLQQTIFPLPCQYPNSYKKCTGKKSRNPHHSSCIMNKINEDVREPLMIYKWIAYHSERKWVVGGNTRSKYCLSHSQVPPKIRIKYIHSLQEKCGYKKEEYDAKNYFVHEIIVGRSGET